MQTAAPGISSTRLPTGAAPTRRSILLRGPGRSRRPLDLAATMAFVAAGSLLIWSAVIHFHLWDETDGYRSIPTIGPLFLLQSLAGVMVGAGLVLVRRLWAALVGLGFALATLSGFLGSVVHGLFGFKDSWLAPFAKEAFTVEVLAAAFCLAAAALCAARSAPRAPTGTSRSGTAA
jgi:hypothetical protein